MMKLLGSNPWRGNAICRVLGSAAYSTEALVSASPSLSESLRRKMWRTVYDTPRVSIGPVIDEWVKEGKEVKNSELRDFIKQLRKARRYGQALEVSEWMSELESSGDIAARLDLISKVRGIEDAQRYFDSIPEPLRVIQVYGSLLYCYSDHRCLEKAEAVFEKMKELGFMVAHNYNTMLALYYRTGEHEKLRTLFKEMEENSIDYDNKTFNFLLLSYAETCDRDEMENLLMKVEADPRITMNWNDYFVAANAFTKAGLFEKASEFLRRSEKVLDSGTRKAGYEHLMTSYAVVGKKDEVFRIWDLYKKMRGFYNNGYRHMVTSLVKLDDIDGAEKVVEEWESGNKFFDIRVPNALINAYCKKGLFEKAESYVKKMTESGKGNVGTMVVLATGYQMNGQMAEAVKAMKKAADFACQPSWKWPKLTSLAACLEYLKEKGDIEEAHEIVRSLSTGGHLPEDLCNKLKTYIDSGEPQVLESLIE